MADTKLDRIAASLDALHRRMDRFEGRDRDDEDMDDLDDADDQDGDDLTERGTPRHIEDEDEDDEPRESFGEVQARADRVAQAFGDSAPPPVRGESLRQYRRRLLSKFAAHSVRWRGVALHRLDDRALAVAEGQVHADALAFAHDPANAPAGALRMITETDETGRRIRRFVGDPENCWGVFKQPTRIVTSWTAAKP